MSHLSHALAARFLLVLLAVGFVLLLLVVLLLGHAHLGAMPVLATVVRGSVSPPA